MDILSQLNRRRLCYKFLRIVFQEMKGFCHVLGEPFKHPRENIQRIYRRYCANLSQKYEKYFRKAIYILLIKNLVATVTEFYIRCSGLNGNHIPDSSLFVGTSVIAITVATCREHVVTTASSVA